MKIRFIGTGSGKSSQHRFHTSFLLDAGHKLLIDAGDGISRALQYAEVNYSEIDSIIITHFHPDHSAGIPMLLNQMKMEKRKRYLSVYIFENAIYQLIQLCEANLIFFENLGFDIRIKPFRNNQRFEITNSLLITARENHHLDKYPQTEIKCFSLFCEPDQIYYTSDIGTEEDLTLFSDKPVQYLISECTHISAPEIIKRINLNDLKKVFLVHIDSENERELKLWYNSLDDKNKSKIVITHDGLNNDLQDN